MYLMTRHIIVNKKKIMSIINYNALKNKHSMFTNDSYQDKNTIKKSVFISQSNDVFTNLALEDWLYRYSNFTQNHVLLLWKNKPCIEIGIDQNPWLELNCQSLEDNGTELVRRKTGGDTVYHNNDNLNMSFFTPHNFFDERGNIEIISRALYNNFGIKSNVDDRKNIIAPGNLKMLCSALKKGQKNAYHHCSLHVDLKEINQELLFKQRKPDISSTKIQSRLSLPNYFYGVHPNVNHDILIRAIGWEYLKTSAIPSSMIEDSRSKLMFKQAGFQMINPDKDWFPGLDVLEKEFRSWQWNYGKTPAFTITRLLKFSTDSMNSQNCWFHLLNLTLLVKNGTVVDIKLSLPPNCVQTDRNQDASVITNLRGSKYNHELTDNIITALGCTSIPLDIGQSTNKTNIAATQ